MHKQRNCGLPEHGGADHSRTAPVVFYGKIPLNPDDPKGPYRTRHVLTECPKSFVTEESLEYLEVFAMHKTTRSLPERGGFLDQPALLMDAIAIVTDEQQLVQQSREAQHRAKQLDRQQALNDPKRK